MVAEGDGGLAILLIVCSTFCIVAGTTIKRMVMYLLEDDGIL